MIKICLANKKGGVGKTTSVANIGVGLVKKGKKVLLIDCDDQSNLTTGLGFEKNAYEFSIYDVIKKEVDIKKAILKRDEGLYLIPASTELRSADQEFSTKLDSMFFLQDSLDQLNSFCDYIIIDCPPHLGYLTNSAMIAANEVFIPVKTEYYSLEGVKDLIEAVTVIKKRFNPALEITRVFATMHTDEIRLNKAVLDELRNIFGDEIVCDTIIGKNISLAEAPSYGESVFEYAPKSRGAKDYRMLCEEIFKE